MGVFNVAMFQMIVDIHGVEYTLELKKKTEELTMKFDRINWRVSETY